PLPAQVHRTVSPTEILTVLGSNTKLPPGATVTSTIVLVADGTPFTAGWPFSSKIVIGAAASSFCGCVLARLPPDSARTRNVIVKMFASQKMNRPAVLNFFMVLTPSSVWQCDWDFVLYLTSADARLFIACMVNGLDLPTTLCS